MGGEEDKYIIIKVRHAIELTGEGKRRGGRGGREKIREIIKIRGNLQYERERNIKGVKTRKTH